METKMKITLSTLDILKLGSSRRLVVAIQGGRTFCLVSMGTGESTPPMSGKELFDYTIKGENPLTGHDRSGMGRKPVFTIEGNLDNIMRKEYPDYGHYGKILVWSEELTDQELISIHTK